jgi:hypothetical protein
MTSARALGGAILSKTRFWNVQNSPQKGKEAYFISKTGNRGTRRGTPLKQNKEGSPIVFLQ